MPGQWIENIAACARQPGTGPRYNGLGNDLRRAPLRQEGMTGWTGACIRNPGRA